MHYLLQPSQCPGEMRTRIVIPALRMRNLRDMAFLDFPKDTGPVSSDGGIDPRFSYS